MRILIASPRSSEQLGDFVYGLRDNVQAVSRLRTGQEAIDALHTFKPDLVVVDEQLPDFGPFQLIIEILKVNAMIQTAVITELDEDEFHVQGEGLGILTAIFGDPGEVDARGLIRAMKGLAG
jgi:DNA-binding response OmpR family regulator